MNFEFVRAIAVLKAFHWNLLSVIRECLSFGLWCFDVDEPIKLEFYISYCLKVVVLEVGPLCLCFVLVLLPWCMSSRKVETQVC